MRATPVSLIKFPLFGDGDERPTCNLYHFLILSVRPRVPIYLGFILVIFVMFYCPHR